MASALYNADTADLSHNRPTLSMKELRWGAHVVASNNC